MLEAQALEREWSLQQPHIQIELTIHPRVSGECWFERAFGHNRFEGFYQERLWAQHQSEWGKYGLRANGWFLG